MVRKLAEHTSQIFKWFDVERQSAYAALYGIIANTYYEKCIIEMIDTVVDERGTVKNPPLLLFRLLKITSWIMLKSSLGPEMVTKIGPGWCLFRL